MSFGDGFLNLPDLFPARQSGEPWGDESVVIGLAGSDYVCTGLSATQATAIREKFGTLCKAAPTESRPNVHVRIFRVSSADFFDDGRIWSYDFDLDYAPDAVRIAGFHVMARLDWRPRLQAALWTSEDARFVPYAIFENILRMIVAYHMLEHGGVLLHSAAVADGRGAHVFFGPSGAGKSTIARLCHAAGYAVMSDDMNALRMTSESVIVEKLPFTGDFGASRDTTEGSYPVRNLCRLEHGQNPAARVLPAAAAIAALLLCAPFVNRNPYRLDELMGTLEVLNARLPVRVLTFALDNRFQHLLQG